MSCDTSGKFELAHTDNTIDIRFSSFMENIDAVCKTASGYLAEQMDGIGEHMFSVNLVMREGLTNAVRHGNQSDPSKDVRFLLKIIGNRSIHMEIEDQGNGFDWRSHQDRDLPETEDHGRGIPIMDTYFTRYTYNDKGNILYLQKDFSI